ncbi:MAG: transposase [Betaproteobacteria bacterium]|nr:transposase [Betaproteobacteria bacterium]
MGAQLEGSPECINYTLRVWTEERNSQLHYIQPGNPQQNACVECFNHTVHYAWLSQHF